MLGAADKTIAALQRAFDKAQRAESKAINALPEKPTKEQSDRCWALAAETNAARDALSKALDDAACTHSLVEVLSTNGRNLDNAKRVCARCGKEQP